MEQQNDFQHHSLQSESSTAFGDAFGSAWEGPAQMAATGTARRPLQRKGPALNLGGDGVIQGYFKHYSDRLAYNSETIKAVKWWLDDEGHTDLWDDFDDDAESKKNKGSVSQWLKTNGIYKSVSSIIEAYRKYHAKKKKKKVKKAYSLEEFNSESESEFENVSSIRYDGLKKNQKLSHVSNDAKRFTAKLSISQLEQHATAVHQAAGGDSRLTIVCAQFLTKDGDYIRAVSSNVLLMPPKARSFAQKYGYVVVRGIKAHAETNMQIYSKKHSKDLKYAGHGCDKAACKQCETNLSSQYGSSVNYGSKGKTNKFSGTYYHSGLDNLTSNSLDFLRTNISSNYNDNGTINGTGKNWNKNHKKNKNDNKMDTD